MGTQYREETLEHQDEAVTKQETVTKLKSNWVPEGFGALPAHITEERTSQTTECYNETSQKSLTLFSPNEVSTKVEQETLVTKETLQTASVAHSAKTVPEERSKE